uniref:Uncharacterized protein n=1 Tax=Plectus sambesii TaxID=2011161 RepID=A0A914WYV7_9BILA
MNDYRPSACSAALLHRRPTDGRVPLATVAAAAAAAAAPPPLLLVTPTARGDGFVALPLPLPLPQRHRSRRPRVPITTPHLWFIGWPDEPDETEAELAPLTHQSSRGTLEERPRLSYHLSVVPAGRSYLGAAAAIQLASCAHGIPARWSRPDGLKGRQTARDALLVENSVTHTGSAGRALTGLLCFSVPLQCARAALPTLPLIVPFEALTQPACAPQLAGVEDATDSSFEEHPRLRLSAEKIKHASTADLSSRSRRRCVTKVCGDGGVRLDPSVLIGGTQTLPNLAACSACTSTHNRRRVVVVVRLPLRANERAHRRPAKADTCDLNAVLFLRLVRYSERESERNVLARTVDNKVSETHCCLCAKTALRRARLPKRSQWIPVPTTEKLFSTGARIHPRLLTPSEWCRPADCRPQRSAASRFQISRDYGRQGKYFVLALAADAPGLFTAEFVASHLTPATFTSPSRCVRRRRRFKANSRRPLLTSDSRCLRRRRTPSVVDHVAKMR